MRLQWEAAAALLAVAYIWLSGSYTHDSPVTALTEFVLTGLFFGFVTERAISIFTPPPSYKKIALHVVIAGFLVLVALPFVTYRAVWGGYLSPHDPFFRFVWTLTNLVGEGPAADVQKFKAGDTLVAVSVVGIYGQIYDPDGKPSNIAIAATGVIEPPGTIFCVVQADIPYNHTLMQKSAWLAKVAVARSSIA